VHKPGGGIRSWGRGAAVITVSVDEKTGAVQALAHTAPDAASGRKACTGGAGL